MELMLEEINYEGAKQELTTMLKPIKYLAKRREIKFNNYLVDVCELLDEIDKLPESIKLAGKTMKAIKVDLLIFANSMNDLEKNKREILYYSLIKDCSDTEIAEITERGLITRSAIQKKRSR